MVLSAVSSLFSFVPLLHVVVRGVPVAVKRLRRVRRFQQLWVPILFDTQKIIEKQLKYNNVIKRYSNERYTDNIYIYNKYRLFKKKGFSFLFFF